MLNYLHKKYYDVLVQPILKRYLKKVRIYTYADLKLKIYPGVFHPEYFFSTQVFAEFIQKLSLKDKKVCEVGAGSGLLSFIAFSKGAKVFSFEISSKAIDGIKENLQNNFKDQKNFNVCLSDLFDQVPENKFDVFLINPPYFFSDPSNEGSYAWYCGKNGEYFEKLFTQLGNYSNTSSQIFMILADNCDRERISTIARKYDYLLNLVHEKKVKWEKNFIFNIVKSA
ncbi:MAG: methyltransferase [Bacteroidetes bacterium]|nr:methyltransferase [Bacteroidota bacterium]